MEIADERRGDAGVEHPLLDLGDRLRRLPGTLTVTRTISEPASASSMHCCAVAGGVRRVGHRHRLHDDGRAAADLDGADLDADGLVQL